MSQCALSQQDGLKTCDTESRETLTCAAVAPVNSQNDVSSFAVPGAVPWKDNVFQMITSVAPFCGGEHILAHKLVRGKNPSVQ